MAIKLSSIDGLIPEKKIVSKHSVWEQGIEINIDNLEHRGFNQAIDLISPKRLEVVICREKLAQIITNWFNNSEDIVHGFIAKELSETIILASKQNKDLVKIVCVDEILFKTES